MRITKFYSREIILALCLFLSIGLLSSCETKKNGELAPFDFISADDDEKESLAVARIKDLEQRIDILETDFREVEPNIQNLIAIESDIQELIIELSKLTDGNVRPAPVPLAEVDELEDENPLSNDRLNQIATPPNNEPDDLDDVIENTTQATANNQDNQSDVTPSSVEEKMAMAKLKEEETQPNPSPTLPATNDNDVNISASDIEEAVENNQNTDNSDAMGFPTPLKPPANTNIQAQNETTQKETKTLKEDTQKETKPQTKENNKDKLKGLGYPNQVSDVRFGVFDGATRMVIDFTKGSDIDYDIAKDGNDILVAFAKAEWLAPDSWQSKSFDLVSGYSSTQTPEEVIMVINTTGKDMTVKVFTLPPVSPDKGPRLVVDFVSGVSS